MANELMTFSALANDTQRLKPLVREEIYQVAPRAALYKQLNMTRTRSMRVGRMTGKIQREHTERRHVVVSAALAAGDSSATIADYEALVKGTILKYEDTGEKIRVTATPTSSTVAISKGAMSTPDTVVPANANLIVLYNEANLDGGDFPDPTAQGTEQVTFQLGSLHNGFKITLASMEADRYGKPEKARIEASKVRKALRDANGLLWSSDPSTTSSGGLTTYTASGLEYWMRRGAVWHDANGPLSYSELMDLLSVVALQEMSGDPLVCLTTAQMKNQLALLRTKVAEMATENAKGKVVGLSDQMLTVPGYPGNIGFEVDEYLQNRADNQGGHDLFFINSRWVEGIGHKGLGPLTFERTPEHTATYARSYIMADTMGVVVPFPETCLVVKGVTNFRWN